MMTRENISLLSGIWFRFSNFDFCVQTENIYTQEAINLGTLAFNNSMFSSNDPDYKNIAKL